MAVSDLDLAIVREAGSLGFVAMLAAHDGYVFASGGSWGTPLFMASSNGKNFHLRRTPACNGLRGLLVEGTDRIFVVGEYGTIGITTDQGKSWEEPETDAGCCLYRIAKDAAGTYWVGGDGGLILRSTTGRKWEPFESGVTGRLLGVTAIDEDVYFWGTDAVVVTKGAAEPLDVDLSSPLTSLVKTSKGTLVLVGDGGQIFRSEDGRSFSRVKSPVTADLEDAAMIGDEVLVVGDGGTVLVSGDDGRTFSEVATVLTGHLWTVAPVGTGALIGGDAGLIAFLGASDDATWEGREDLFEDLVDAAPSAADDDDEDTEEEPETPQVDFDSIEEASKRWIEEGNAYYDALNEYIKRIYEVGFDEAGEEPQETRGDMREYVTRQMVALNEREEFFRLRELFPPSYEPFEYEGRAKDVPQVMLLPDERIVAIVDDRGGRRGYVMAETKIENVQKLVGVGRAAYHRFYAKAYPDRIDVHETWDGPAVRAFPWPDGYGAAVKDLPAEAWPSFGPGSLSALRSLAVFPDGMRLLLATDEGVWVSTLDGCRLLHPSAERLNECYESFEEDGGEGEMALDLSYCHAALSADGTYIAVGDQDSSHIILHEVDGEWVEAANVEPRSSYPHLAVFHDIRPHVALSACHFARSATLGVDLGKLPGFSASGYDGDTNLDYIDGQHWVFSAAPIREGYVLGANNGYLWARAFSGEKSLWYLHLGSTISSMDIDEDKKTLVVGTYAGYVVRLRFGEGRDRFKVTDTDVLEDRRWVFWRGLGPLTW